MKKVKVNWEIANSGSFFLDLEELEISIEDWLLIDEKDRVQFLIDNFYTLSESEELDGLYLHHEVVDD